LLARAISALPEGLLRPIVRADSGFFDAKLATAALTLHCDYAIAVKRTDAVWRAERKIPDGDWQRAIGMDAEVAECGYVPKGWPKGSRTICRRVKVTAAELSSDPRSRRRRTIDPNQLSLLTSGEADFAYAYSFIITNLSATSSTSRRGSACAPLSRRRSRIRNWVSLCATCHPVTSR